MENNLANNAESGNTTPMQEAISDEKKITLINLMFRKSTNATFLGNRDGIKALPLLTEEEKAFIDEVYEKIKELGIGEEVLQVTNVSKLQEELYDRCQIPREAVERVQQENAKRTEKFKENLEKDQRKWDARMAEEEKKYARTEETEVIDEQPKIEVIEGGQKEESEKTVGYKEDLYQPGFLCGHSLGMPEKPFVELVRYTQERVESVSAGNTYQFSDKTYTIKKTGELLYMSAPNLKDTLSEYEITITKGNISKTVRRFGEISLHKMSDASYSTVVFLGLLGQANLTDEELHGYLGSLELTKVQNEEGELEDSYRVVHSPEEYTAVVMWEEIAKAREGIRKVKNNSEAKSNGDKAVGGDAR